VKTFHVITGLPRSGSTLLASILKQNPSIHTGVSTACLGLIEQNLTFLSKSESAVEITAEMRQNIAIGALHGFYAHVQRPVVIDTNRFWSGRIPLLNAIWPEKPPKLIACVRSVPEILESLEDIHARNILEPNRITDYRSLNLYGRVRMVWEGPLLGDPHAMLREAVFGPYRHQLMLVRYESLVQTPEKVLKAIYDFIELPAFQHRLDQIQGPDSTAYDKSIGVPDLHRVRPTISRETKPRRLTPDLLNRYSRENFWEQESFRQTGVKII